MYLVQTNHNADGVNPDDWFKYIDGLTILQLISLAGILTDYNFQLHLASDIDIDPEDFPATNYNIQNQIYTISGLMTTS